MSSVVEIKLKIPQIREDKPKEEYNEIEKMISGLPYLAYDPIILNGRAFAYKMCLTLNQKSQLEVPQRYEILQQLLGTCSKGVYIEPPFFCDYGSNIHLGEGVYMNFNCTLLDACEIKVGARTMFAPGNAALNL